MNKYVLGAVGIIIIAFLVFAVNASDDKSEEKKQVASIITVENTFHDFGDIDIFGGKVSATYILKNEGVEDVIITSGLTSCMCTEGKIGNMKFGMHGATGEKVIIKSGEEEILTAIYDPLAHGPDGTGKITRELTLKTNSTATPEIEVRLSANVVK